ncbi:MAG: phosphotransferase family protein [Anaerolineales bacterium]
MDSQKSHELEVKGILQDYFQERFFHFKGGLITDLSHIAAGWESDIYAFKLIPQDGKPQGLILRLFPGTGGYEKSGREFSNLEFLVKHDYPVPSPLILERDNSPFETPFIIIEKIPGRTLWDPLFTAQVNRRQELIDGFFSLFVQLHQLDPSDFIDRSPGGPEVNPESLLVHQLDNWHNLYEKFPLPDFLPLFDWLYEHAREISPGRQAVLHGDFHPENILLQPDGKMVVIDWTGLQVSDPRFDLAWTLLLITAYEGFHWRQPFLESYERQAGIQIEQLHYFDVAACARRLYSIAVSLAAGAGAMGMRPGAEQQMMGQIEPAGEVYELLQHQTGISLPIIEAWLSKI